MFYNNDKLPAIPAANCSNFEPLLPFIVLTLDLVLSLNISPLY